MYEIREEIMNNLKDEFEDELTERGYEFTNEATNKIFAEWAEKKQMLLELLSKHPNWVPERMMIRFSSEFSRNIDSHQAGMFLRWLRDYTSIDNVRVSETNCFHDTVKLRFVLERIMCHNTYLPENDDFVERQLNLINELSPDFKFRPGMKVTKIMGKICRHYGWDKTMASGYDRDGNAITYNAYEREFAKYCDAMSPIKATRHTCISLNPLDYLLMSHGNSWRSCHYIGNTNDYMGEYSSGTISYMLDEHSIIFYTVDASYDGEEIELEPKVQRQVFGYNDHQLLQSRLYPQNNDIGADHIYTEVRSIMQKIIADCLEKPNLWVKRKVRNATKSCLATCYPDWEYSDLCSTSVLKEKREEVDLKAIVLGSSPICVTCGNKHSVNGSISCCKHIVRCVDCGAELDADDAIWLDGDPYCSHCVEYCERCHSYHRSESYYIESEDRYVCEWCLEYYYKYCEECGNYHNESNMTWIEDENMLVCSSCLNEHYSRCNECGEYIRSSNLIAVEVTNENGEIETFNLCYDCSNH